MPSFTVQVPEDNGRALTDAVANVDKYDWLVFTSTNAVDAFVSALPGSWPVRPKVAAVGSATTHAIDEAGGVVDLVPDEAVGVELAKAFPSGSGRVLIPQAADAGTDVAEGLGHMGWNVDAVVAYRKVIAAVDESVRNAAAEADAVLFSSPSTVRNFVKQMSGLKLPPIAICIGPTTAAAAAAAEGLERIVAKDHSDKGMIAALMQTLHYA